MGGLAGDVTDGSGAEAVVLRVVGLIELVLNVRSGRSGVVERDVPLDPAGADAAGGAHTDPTRISDLMARRSSIAA